VASAQECTIDSRRRLAARRGAPALVSDLRRVDADVADALDLVIDAHVDRVTVVDVKDDRFERWWRVGPRGSPRRRREEGHRANETVAHGKTIMHGHSGVNVRSPWT